MPSDDPNGLTPPVGLADTFQRVGHLVGRGLVWLEEHPDAVSDFFGKSLRHKDGRWAYLTELVDGVTGVTLLIGLEAASRLKATEDQLLGDALASWLLEPELLVETRAALERTTAPTPNKRQLAAGLDYLEICDYELAVPLLIIPLEGVFWHLAESRGIVSRGRKGVWRRADKPEVTLHAVNQLFPLEGLGLDETQQRFLKGLAYGTEGNWFRHGTAIEEFRLRALCLFVSLMAWLEVVGEFDVRTEVRAASLRARAAQSRAEPCGGLRSELDDGRGRQKSDPAV